MNCEQDRWDKKWRKDDSKDGDKDVQARKDKSFDLEG